MNDYRIDLLDHCCDFVWLELQARGRLVCPCGCHRFYLFSRKKSAEEKLEEAAVAKRLADDYWPFGPVFGKSKSGRAVVWKEFLGLKWKERPFSDYKPSVLSFPYVSAKCANCKNEIVLFDGRQYVHDDDGLPLQYGELGEIKWNQSESIVECVFDYSEKPINLKEFDRLRIYKVANGKKALFFDHEM